jgi:hypothetical protein
MMRPWLVAILGTLAVLVFAPIPSSFAQETGDLGPLRKALKAKAPAAERAAALAAASGVDGKDAAALFLDALEGAQERLLDLSLKRAKVRARLAEEQGEEGTRAVPFYGDRGPAIEALRAEEGVLRAEDGGEHAVMREAKDRLRRLRDPAAMSFLGAALKARRPAPLRRALAEVLASMETAEAHGLLLAAVGEKDPEVREAIVVGLGRGLKQREDARAALAAAVEDPAWPVRLAAMRALALNPNVETVDLLVARMAREAGRMTFEVGHLLGGMTGQKFGADAEGWRHWWTENRTAHATGVSKLKPGPFAPGDPGTGERQRGAVRYHGIDSWSRRILFVLDISGSMDEPGGRDPNKPRLDEAKTELLNTLRTLGGDATFSVFVFHDSVHKWKPGLVAATEKARAEATEWVKELGPSSWTNTFAALEEAIRVSAAGGMDADYGGGADTIFLLTDGSPTTPEGETAYPDGSRETDRVLEAAREWNPAGRVTIHCIGVGDTIDRRFLERLAKENGGRCVLVK